MYIKLWSAPLPLIRGAHRLIPFLSSDVEDEDLDDMPMLPNEDTPSPKPQSKVAEVAVQPQPGCSSHPTDGDLDADISSAESSSSGVEPMETSPAFKLRTPTKKMKTTKQRRDPNTGRLTPRKKTFFGIRMKKSPAKATATTKYKYLTGTKGKLSEMGWYDVPVEYSNQDVFTLFTVWYESQYKPKRTSANNVSNIGRLMYFMGGEQSTFTTKVITMENYKNLNDRLRSEGDMDFQTLYNYNKTLKNFVKYVTSSGNMCTENPAEYARLKGGVTDNIVLIGTGLDNQAKEQRRHNKSEKMLQPPTPYEVQEVLRVGKLKFQQMMSTAATGSRLNRDEVAYVNRYMSSHVLLRMANRPSMLEYLTELQFSAAMQKPSLEHGGTLYWVIHASNHKTADQFDANLVLQEEWKDIFRTYHEHVRTPIKTEHGVSETRFFLQKNGVPFTKFSEAPGKLQKRFKLPLFSCSDARKSVETYTQNLPADQKKDIADFLCHSEHTRDTSYRVRDVGRSINAFTIQEQASEYYRSHSRQDIPTTFDGFKAPVSLFQSVPASTMPTSTVTTEDTTSRTPCQHTPKRHRTPPGVSPMKTPPTKKKRPDMPTTPGTPIQEKVETLVVALKSRYGDIVSAVIPTVSTIQTEYGYKKKSAMIINRKIRHCKYLGLTDMIAQKTLKTAVKAGKMNCIAELDDLPQVPDEDTILRLGGVKIKRQDIARSMKDQLNAAKSLVSLTSDDSLRNRVNDQQWPDLTIKDTLDRGKGTFNGLYCKQKGAVVCDYHGQHLTAKEGEERIKNIQPPESNYIMFFKNKAGKKMCVDACIGCGCHTKETFINTYGRLINHPTPPHTANLKPKTMEVHGREYVFLIATRKIRPYEELFFNYGITKADDGSKLEWLKK